MEGNRYEVLSNAYRNPTKFSIVLLLAEHERMTVTQMSRYISVSRSNIYHFVSQLVEDGILNEPEVVPKKNYVEKFYRLNQQLFESVDPEEWRKMLRRMKLIDLRGLLSSVLMGYSLVLSMAAERVARSSDDDIKRMMDSMLSEPTWSLSYSVVGSRTANRLRPVLRKLNDEMVQSSEPTEESKSDQLTSLLVVFMPMI